jgi:predicted transposase YbfD/YdcC
VFSSVDAAALDKAVGTWLRGHSRRDFGDVLCLAVDGKTLRGVTIDDDHQFTLLSAMIHQEGVTIAQVAVPPDTKENTQLKALLEQVPAREGERVVVTTDAAHTQRDTASYLAGTRGFDYVMNVKGNRPTLFNAVFSKASPLVKNKPDHVISERRHGRINQWETWITDASTINFPHARQVGCIRRDVYALDDQRVSREYAWIITSIPANNMDAAKLHEHVRSHWGIENKSHYVRDTTWSEDAHNLLAKNAAHIMATLRNTAISLLRLHQHHDIKRTTERICRNPNRALHLLIT